MNNKRIVVLEGDGIGPEVTRAALAVAEAAVAVEGVQLQVERGLIGGAAIDATGAALPQATIDLCRSTEAVLLGAVGGPKWDDPQAEVRPEQGLLGLRKEFGLFANLRPVRPVPGIAKSSPLRPELVAGVDMLFVRELTGGIYFGEKQQTSESARDVCAYGADEVARVVRVAGRLARQRRGKLVSVDKANVLATSRLWREVASRVIAEEFAEVSLEHVLVDAMAMHLLTRPADFDVIVTENMFGDILTDEASVLGGSLGMLPSASLGEGGFGVYEPIHGSAPQIAGQGIANPFGAILSAAMMLRHSLGLDGSAARIEAAVSATVADGVLPADLSASDGRPTSVVVEAVCRRVGS